MSDAHLLGQSVPLSFMSNRLVELESSVAHLQATIDGLQESLVDSNERIRALERKLKEYEEQSSAEDNHAPDETEESAEPVVQAEPDAIGDIIVA